MINWNETMIQTFEYYKVNPKTWMDEKILNNIIDSSIDIDSGAETLGSATFTTSEILDECYIRIYLIAIQNGIREKIPLGTYLVQSPAYNFDGKLINISLDAYTPLIELKEKMPPLGYFTKKDKNILDETYRLIKDNLRAPVVKSKSDDKVPYDFVSNTDDTWLTFVKDLVATANYEIDIDEMGRIVFEPKKLTNALAPKWIYTDDNSSILYPDISIDNDIYGIPNVVEVIYSSDKFHHYVRVENNEDDSPISIKNRGREIIHRVNNPEISGTPTPSKIKRYAEDLLKELSSIEYSITYTHGYCPVKVGDCVMLNYKKANIKNVKAKVVSQNISCIPGTPVEEKAVFTDNLWRR